MTNRCFETPGSLWYTDFKGPTMKLQALLAMKWKIFDWWYFWKCSTVTWDLHLGIFFYYHLYLGKMSHVPIDVFVHLGWKQNYMPQLKSNPNMKLLLDKFPFPAGDSLKFQSPVFPADRRNFWTVLHLHFFLMSSHLRGYARIQKSQT